MQKCIDICQSQGPLPTLFRERAKGEKMRWLWSVASLRPQNKASWGGAPDPSLWTAESLSKWPHCRVDKQG